MTAIGARKNGYDAKVVVVSVTYNPPDTAIFLTQMASIAEMNCAYIIVDNGSSSIFREWLASHALGNVRVILLEKNLGIAAAQNIGISAARERNGSHILLLDHDSVPHSGMVDELLRVMHDKVSKGMQVAAVGPQWIDSTSGRAAPFSQIGWFGFHGTVCSEAVREAIKVDILFSSGMLISIKAWDGIGPMREEFFIDHVDTDWCLRARAAGWSLYGVCNAVLDHALGERAIRIWVGRMRSLHVHSPERVYYFVRNSIALTKLDSTPVRWISAELPRLCGLSAAYLAFVPPRLRYLSMIVRAVRDGLTGRMGPLNRACARNHT